MDRSSITITIYYYYLLIISSLLSRILYLSFRIPNRSSHALRSQRGFHPGGKFVSRIPRSPYQPFFVRAAYLPGFLHLLTTIRISDFGSKLAGFKKLGPKVFRPVRRLHLREIPFRRPTSR